MKAPCFGFFESLGHLITNAPVKIFFSRRRPQKFFLPRTTQRTLDIMDIHDRVTWVSHITGEQHRGIYLGTDGVTYRVLHERTHMELHLPASEVALE